MMNDDMRNLDMRRLWKFLDAYCMTYFHIYDVAIHDWVTLVTRLHTVATKRRAESINDLTRASAQKMAILSLNSAMKGCSILILLIAVTFVSAKKSGDVTELQIGVKFKPASCEIQAHKGDRIKVHYRGKLTDGTVFDSSFERGDPIEFELGTGQVIKGWDQGLLGMCVGEKRKLKIPSKMGYGDQGSPPTIPGGATLIFDTELIAVNGKGSDGDTKNNEL
ncbi:hypothetical protein L2E82_20302 [Cichorium intybus]|uniref:Uncharacterized protein n=1 Tax=Cichorium intybus TaxID=13427 RepID=A0ACB9DTA3_CICIN|nr:hypothetical protein L2E82_20302 [Cichorium intybus]